MYKGKEDFLNDLDENSKMFMDMVDANPLAPFGAYRALYLTPIIIEGIWSGDDFEVSTACLDMLFYAYNVWIQNKKESLYTLFFAAMELEELPAWDSYNKPLKRERFEKGQPKIFFSSIRSFVGLKKEEIKVLVIGSSSPSEVSGISYLMIADIMTDYGYRGEFHLYDLYERQTDTLIGAFKIFRHVELYKFKDYGDYDIILDDSFHEEHMVKGGYEFESCEVDIIGQQGKFVVVEKGKNIFIIGREVMTHDKVTEELNIKGGGSYLKKQDKIVITSNLSGKYGAVGTNSLALNGFVFDEMGFKNFKSGLINSGKIVNLKWPYLSNLEGADMMEQFCYIRNERRALLNHVKLTPGIVYGESDGCKLCRYVSSVMKGIVAYKPIDYTNVFRKFFYVCGEMCRPFATIKTLSMKAYLYNAIIRGDRLNNTILAISDYLGVEKENVRELYETMEKNGDFSVKMKKGKRLEEGEKLPFFLKSRKFNYPGGWKFKKPVPAIVGMHDEKGEVMCHFVEAWKRVEDFKDYIFFYNDVRTLRYYSDNNYEEEGNYKEYTFMRRKDRNKSTKREISVVLSKINGYAYSYSKKHKSHDLTNGLVNYYYKGMSLYNDESLIGDFEVYEVEKIIKGIPVAVENVTSKVTGKKKVRRKKLKGMKG